MTPQKQNKEIEKELEDLKLSKEIYSEAKSIILGERGLMPIVSNNIEIVWVHPSGYGRKAILNVTKEGKKEFEKVMEICKRNYDNKRIIEKGSLSKQKEMLDKFEEFIRLLKEGFKTFKCPECCDAGCDDPVEHDRLLVDKLAGSII